LIFLIAALSTQILISQKALPWCAFSPGSGLDAGTAGVMENWPLQYLWLFLCMLVGTISIIIVIVQLIRNFGGARFAVQQNIRLILFLVLLWFVLAYRIAFKVQNTLILSNILAFNALWQECNTYFDGCIIPGSRESAVLLWLFTLSEYLVQTVGTVILFSCAADLWLGFRDVVTGKVSPLDSYTAGGTTSTAGSSSSQSGSGSESTVQGTSWIDA